MLRSLILTCLICVILRAAGPPGPSEFYVVSAFFSDHGVLFYHRVVAVRQDGSDTVVRYIRIAPASAYCARTIVHAAEARVSGKSPAQLIGRNNPCDVNPQTFRATLPKPRKNLSAFEATSYGIVAQCGDTSISLGLPIAQEVDLEQLKSTHPALARLWSLSSEIVESTFGNKDVFHDRSEAEDSALQQAGEKLVPELIAGGYDRGLREARRGNVGGAKELYFRTLLSDYRGPMTDSEVKQSEEPKLKNAAAYRFANFVAPKYPRLALQARISGEVDLVLKVNPETGKVLEAEASKGHQLLGESATEAARRWHFQAGSLKDNTVNITIEYALPCSR